MRYILLSILISIASSLALSGQELYLQLERANSLKVKRYAPGDHIRYRTKQYDAWQSGRIDQLLYEDRALVFADRITYLRDMTHFSYDRRFVQGLGGKLQQAGVTWLALSGLTEGLKALGVLESGYDFGWDTLAIGAGAYAGGLIIRRTWGTARIRLNDRRRLRIVDLDF